VKKNEENSETERGRVMSETVGQVGRITGRRRIKLGNEKASPTKVVRVFARMKTRNSERVGAGRAPEGEVGSRRE